MPYSESGPDSNCAINSASNFDYSSSSFSESESDFSSVFINLDIRIFLFYVSILLNKLADGFVIHSHNSINSYASNASVIHIFFWHIITQKFFFITPSNSLALAFKYFFS